MATTISSTMATKPTRPKAQRVYSRRPSTIGDGSVPKARKPKDRPPAQLRDKLGLIHGALPRYSGPYAVSNIRLIITTTAANCR
jgi:hypothetical protein